MTRVNANTDARGDGSREVHVRSRNGKIKEAAMTLAKEGTWPSPVEIAKITGISASVIDREKPLLLAARRKWVELNGRPHPQWRDPDAVEPSQPSSDIVRVQPPDDEKESKRKIVIREQRVTIRNLKTRVEQLEEQVQRLLRGVRPSELKELLEAGTPKHRLN